MEGTANTDPWLLIGAAEWMVAPLARREYWKKTSIAGEGHEFRCGHVEFEVFLKHARGDVEQTVEHTCMELNRGVLVGDTCW